MSSSLIAHIAPANPGFFPTDDAVTARMVEPYKKKILGNPGWQILDPSAGSGSMLDYLTSTEFSYDGWGGRGLSSRQLYAIEADDELRFLLQGKNYKVIHSDFLTYEGDYLFDLILMNPPFSRGDDHLLKAWDVLQTGHIACLLNEETILNPYSAKRKLLKSIIDQHGSVEFLGECFSTADRKTDVRVALVRLEKKEKAERFDFRFERPTAEPIPDFSERIAQAAACGDELAVSDLTGAMIRQYELTKQAFVNYCRAKKEMDFYAQGLISPYKNISKMADEHYSTDISSAYNGFVDELKGEAWETIIGKLGISKLMTTEARHDFNSFKRAQGAAELTRENIFALLMMLVENRGSMMDKAVVSVFDVFTAYHKDNRCHVEGWKTNSAWKVNRKVILPNWVRYGGYSSGADLKKFGDTFKTSTESERYDDIDKVMCWLTGKNYEQCRTIRDALTRHFQAIGTIKTGDVFDNEGESEFFTFKFWKKGTLHIVFKDAGLWEEFNYRATLGKKWLPAEEARAYRASKAAAAQPEDSCVSRPEGKQLSAPAGMLPLDSSGQLQLFMA